MAEPYPSALGPPPSPPEPTPSYGAGEYVQRHIDPGEGYPGTVPVGKFDYGPPATEVDSPWRRPTTAREPATDPPEKGDDWSPQWEEEPGESSGSPSALDPALDVPTVSGMPAAPSDPSGLGGNLGTGSGNTWAFTRDTPTPAPPEPKRRDGSPDHTTQIVRRDSFGDGPTGTEGPEPAGPGAGEDPFATAAGPVPVGEDAERPPEVPDAWPQPEPWPEPRSESRSEEWHDELGPADLGGPARQWGAEPSVRDAGTQAMPGTGGDTGVSEAWSRPEPWPEPRSESRSEEWHDELGPADLGGPARQWGAEPSVRDAGTQAMPAFSGEPGEAPPVDPVGPAAPGGYADSPDNWARTPDTAPGENLPGPGETGHGQPVPHREGEWEPHAPAPEPQESRSRRGRGGRDPITEEFPEFDNRPPGDESGWYPGYDSAVHIPETEGLAKATLALGILAVLLGPLGVLLGPVALLLAPKARRNIRDSHGELEGEKLVGIGTVLAWVGLALGVLAIAGGAALALF